MTCVTRAKRALLYDVYFGFWRVESVMYASEIWDICLRNLGYMTQKSGIYDSEIGDIRLRNL